MKFKLYLKSPIGLTIKFEESYFIVIPYIFKKSFQNLKKKYGKEWSNTNPKYLINIEFMWLCFKFELEYRK